jgi:hypothetical protein
MASHLLEDHGYIFLKGVYPRELIEEFNGTLNEYVTRNRVFATLQKPMDMDETELYINNTYSNTDTYHKMLFYGKPVVDNRGARNRTTNVGFYDFYQAQRIFPNLLEIFQIKTLEAILQKTTSRAWRFHRCNIHICNHVRNPESFHTDGLQDEIRVLIYLSDILEENQGAPVFIKGTHTREGRAKGIRREDVKTFCGEKGDLLVSYENGLHRRLPQEQPSINGFIAIHFL